MTLMDALAQRIAELIEAVNERLHATPQPQASRRDDIDYTMPAAPSIDMDPRPPLGERPDYTVPNPPPIDWGTYL